MAFYDWTTCPTDIRQQVNTLSTEFQRILDNNLIGIYLHGSLSMGCFNPSRSDIDVLVVTAETPLLDQLREITTILLQYSAQPSDIEISFFNQQHLATWEHPLRYDYHYNEDWREKMQRELADNTWQTWLADDKCDGDLAGHITIMNHRGVVLHGAPIADVFPPVPLADYRASILSDYEWLKPHYLQNPVYGVLNMCRVVQHLREGAISSKAEGALWALEHLAPEHHPLIRQTLACYRDDAPTPDDEVALEAFAVYIESEIASL